MWKPAHPKLKLIVSDLEKLQRQINIIKEQNADLVKGRVAATSAEVKSLEVSIPEWEIRVREAGRKDAEHQTLEGNVARIQTASEKLAQELRDIQIGGKASLDPFQVIQKATVAKPVPLGTIKHVLLGLIGGLVVGTIILIVLDRADDRLASSAEMIEHFSESTLGQIPNVTETRGASGLALLQEEDERYTYAEAFRSLRSSLIFMPNQTELKSILITSAIPNEGKSTIASNLAITMAAAGARVLLVDADLRRGDLAQLFDVDGKVGLSDVLRGEVPWKSAVLQTKYPTLSLIPRGPVTNQSGELLLRPMLVGLLDELKASYDLVVFNTAPILAADDTHVPQAVVGDDLQRLEGAGDRLVGDDDRLEEVLAALLGADAGQVRADLAPGGPGLVAADAGHLDLFMEDRAAACGVAAVATSTATPRNSSTRPTQARSRTAR